MAAQQIAELFGSVGFKIDANSWKTLDKFENKLDTIKKKINSTFAGKTGGLRGGGGGTSGGARGGQGGRGGRSGLSLAGSALSNIHTIGMFLTGGALVGSGIGILQTAAKYDALKSSMLAATGTAALADEQMKFLEGTSRRLGLVTTEISRPFVNFSVAAKENGISLKGTQKIYTQFAEASRGLNLTADDTAGVFRALSQMFSKGTVQAEELKGQLGERLAGAYPIAAKAMGLTTEEMGKQLKAGKILAKDLIPLLADEYEKLVKGTGALDKALTSTSFRLGRLAEEWNRFKNRLAEGNTGQQLNKMLVKLTKSLEVMGQEGGALDTAAYGLGRIFEAMGNVVGSGVELFKNYPKVMTALTTLAAGFALVSSPALLLISSIVLLIALLDDIRAFTKGEKNIIGKYLFGDNEQPFTETEKMFPGLRDFSTKMSEMLGSDSAGDPGSEGFIGPPKQSFLDRLSLVFERANTKYEDSGKAQGNTFTGPIHINADNVEQFGQEIDKVVNL